MGVLKTIFILVFVYYLIRFLNRYILPFFRAAKSANNFQKPKKKSKKDGFKDPGGEYIDFEEIKE